MNMFKKNSSTSVQQYLDNIPEERQGIIFTLHKLILETVPELESHFATNMLGYGSFKYLDSKKKENDWPIIALANQKNYISLYVCAVKDGRYLAEEYADRLGKVNVGRSCIRFKKLEQVNLDVFAEVLREAAKNPGLVGAKTA